ncbi:hypothetical protein GCM10011487_31650 [Steroidobacter agaridevorans]|uniref:Lipoprotein n=1 Tax=Steroidobacter agaridevorans TaxID=2695856 RepID=A0A829YD41_9GAMM|nr:hypothetical protein GCM10011487_31650 [Steroidobacter agaridevorans]GFE88950.1 hypothetical protein GCM10011488_39040 [Steroidobacter agaridevorans]
MSTRLSLWFSKRVCASVVVAISSALAGCETYTYGRVVIETPAPIDPRCIGAAAGRVDPGEVYGPGPRQGGAVEIGVKRGTSAVGIHLYEGIITVQFGWSGRESEEVEAASFRLLDDVRHAVTDSCAIQQPPATITSNCRTRSIRDCEKLLDVG